jgi:CRP-like cAMP-binding protein
MKSDLWEVHLNSRCIVEIIRKHIQGHMRDNFRDFAVGKSRGAHCLHVFLALYHCFAQATEASRVRSISRAQLEPLLHRYPSITRRLLDLVSERFVHVLMDLEDTSFRHLISRMARLLLENANEDCVQGITHREIAEHLRVHRESATATLGELRRAGIIAVERKQIRIIERARLERAARE